MLEKEFVLLNAYYVYVSVLSGEDTNTSMLDILSPQYRNIKI